VWVRKDAPVVAFWRTPSEPPTRMAETAWLVFLSSRTGVGWLIVTGADDRRGVRG
jgi:hypothetical protein